MPFLTITLQETDPGSCAMAAVRRNILDNAIDRDRFIQACLALKQEPTGLTTNELGIAAGLGGQAANLSVWDLFVIWHVRAMQQMSSDFRRNAAHSGPVFLPWHRWYLLVLEFEMRRVLGVGPDDFAMPYWDWAADGEGLSEFDQVNSAPLWSHIGGNGQGFNREVSDGPFVSSNFRINVEQAPGGQMRATDRGLRRNFGVGVGGLPTTTQMNTVLAKTIYDEVDYDQQSDGLRNFLEGWAPSALAPASHNRVHVWVGGDMSPGTSPNDPVFFLNHCNVDRIWSQWQSNNVAAGYRPQGRSTTTNDPLFRQRSEDPLYSILTDEPPVSAMFDLNRFYTYA